MTLLDILPSLRNGSHPRLDPAIWPRTTHVDEAGRITVGGVALADIADQYGTPAYVIDEADFRGRIRTYRKTLPDSAMSYAGKALLTTGIAGWVAQEGLGVDVCSPGELATAIAGGIDPARIIVHGFAKTYDDLRIALAAGVGRVVVDSPLEITYLANLARRPQSVLVRVTPDLDIHGHPAVTTGVDDQKFGLTLSGDQAMDAVRRILTEPQLRLVGLHCHLGSQITDPALFGEAIHRLIAAMADVRSRHGVLLGELNIGGGHGVPYVVGDAELDLSAFAATVDDALDLACAAERFPRPRLAMEPGRAIAARAGVTLYRVSDVKKRPGGRTFIAVDGGMSDNPRVALYGARYTVAVANRHAAGPSIVATVAGRHCEAGDVIARDVEVPADIHAGDLLAVACTGAYHHSMASTYNMVGRPPLISVRDSRLHALVRRETTADLLARDRG